MNGSVARVGSRLAEERRDVCDHAFRLGTERRAADAVVAQHERIDGRIGRQTTGSSVVVVTAVLVVVVELVVPVVTGGGEVVGGGSVVVVVGSRSDRLDVADLSS